MKLSTLIITALSTLIITTQTLLAKSDTPTDTTTDITVEGMHCGGCKKMITKNVCDNKELSEQFETCTVNLVDTKKQIGKISVKMKPGQTLDLSKVEAAVKKAGDDYKVIKPEQVK